jgi:hypothetical protein
MMPKLYVNDEITLFDGIFQIFEAGAIKQILPAEERTARQ